MPIDTRTPQHKAVHQIVARLVWCCHIEAAEQVLVAAHESCTLPESTLTEISKANGLKLRWYQTVR